MLMLSKIDKGQNEILEYDFEKSQKFFFSSVSGNILFAQTILHLILVFPFYFFMAKEYSFILYDELKHRSLSNKIEELKKYASMKDVYTENMVQKIRDDIYILVRQPYLKLNNKEFYTFTTILASPIFIVTLLFIFFQNIQQYRFAMYFTMSINFIQAGVVPLIMLILPGILYYKADQTFDIKSPLKYLAILWVIGGAFGIVYFAASSSYTNLTYSGFVQK
ncbi:UNKNOWN [Stylonychia lemnae]|uniref:Uncharacterized protein n=1 Tax=Stylonychia lemnae TaxID=5949 RepID=A0A078A7S7_STYLE|nr:UNKNOWN [Stylonychia lemnae]|eukprot:CDW76841.1 UNKNOWN [Stylonychia lemnae]